MGHKYYTAVNALMEETLCEDPVDVGLLPIDEETAKQLIVSSMCEHWDDIVAKASSKDELAITALTVMSKLAYENFVLHIQVKNATQRTFM